MLTAAARRGFSKRGEGRERERPGERYTHRPTAPRPEPVGDERTADEEALGELATERQRELACLAILDADRDRDEPIVACELDQRAHVRVSTGVFGRSSDESPRDLELVELRRERPARRVRDPNAIERDAHARSDQARDRGTQSSGSKRLRAELEGDGSGPERSERFENRVHVRELRPGDVDADAQPRALRTPFGPLSGRGADDPHADLVDEGRRDREEIARLEKTEPRVAPAQQRLHAAAFAAPQVDDRLVVEDELVARQRGRELAVADRQAGRLTRSPAASRISANEPLDNGARRRPLHAMAASCESVTRRVRPPSRRSTNTRTRPASHCVPAPWRSLRRASSSSSPAR